MANDILNREIKMWLGWLTLLIALTNMIEWKPLWGLVAGSAFFVFIWSFFK